MASKQKMGNKQKTTHFYTWWHNEGAGVVTTYKECEEILAGKAGRNCKRHEDLAKAEEMKEEKLRAIEAKKERETTENQNQEPAIANGDTTSADDNEGPLLENIERRLENLQEFENTQTTLNDKFEQAITSEMEKSNTLNERMEDMEKRIKSKMKDITIQFDKKLEEAKENMRKEFAFEIKGLKQKLNHVCNELSTVTKKLNILMDKLEKPDGARPTAEPISVDSNDDNPWSTPLNTRNRFEALENNAKATVTPPALRPAATPNNEEGSTPDPTRPAPRPEATPNNEQRNTATAKGPILIVADSMVRGIKQTLLARDCYVNKQVIQGGTREAINYVNSMNDDTTYRQVVLHIGTNDVNTKHKDIFMNEYLQLITMIRSKWENCRIVVSGIIEHRTDREKNRLVKELNREMQTVCEELENAVYCDNSRLTRRRDGGINERVFFDEIHLNNQTGTRILAANLKEALGLRTGDKNPKP